ncbi:ApbE family protein [Bifidobacterium callitrichos DSM 23973]|uniref:FAD:protein FMN transferase n=2 Tax=Bifidobacterium callitrichos TaxID=762209 RepID=A0A086ZYN3_9BIFI|nr:ApbE family protein [Bifidobacterium callitrichos DSM 23973]
MMAFPHALGTGLLIQSPLDPDGFAIDDSPSSASSPARHGISNYDAIDILIDEYEQALSRFCMHSLVDEMRRAAHGGSFDFPDWAGPLFDLYDALVHATDGAIDPCIGEDLIRLGYDARYSFRLSPDALTTTDSGTGEHTDGGNLAGDATNDHRRPAKSPVAAETVSASPAAATGWNLGSMHGRATWREDVERRGTGGTTLVTRRPVALDFGACGKGYLVDLIAQRFLDDSGSRYAIDAGGDLLIRSPDKPLTIALEDPTNTENAVGTAQVGAGAFCASAPSRRHWEAAGHRLHHLLNAIDGLPENDVAATWVCVPMSTHTAVDRPISTDFPTALADGVATALFTTPANQLHKRLAEYTASQRDSQGTPHDSPSNTAHTTSPEPNAACTTTPDYAAFECAVLNSDRTVVRSAGFPGDFFIR